MRYVWAIVALVLATLLIGAGIAQRTVFLGPSTQQTAVEVEQASPYTLVDGAVLRTQAGAQTLLVRGEGEIFAAYGRTHDMQAWLEDAVYNRVFVDDQGAITVEVMHPELPVAEEPPAEEGESEQGAEETASEEDASAADDAETTPAPGYPARNPAGSDLWLDQFTDTEGLSVDMQLPEGMSVLIARDGVDDAPTDIAVAWPVDNSTPWAGPLVVAGGVLMLVGIVLYILAIRFQRRGGGPRRKGPGPLPATEPLDIEQLRAEERAALTTGPRAKSSSRRRTLLALPAVGLTLALVTGCSPDSWPTFLPEETPTPEPSETIVAPENQQAPAITESQAARILKSIADTVAQADEERDAELLATRMSGMPLQERTTNYQLRGEIEGHRESKPIPTETIEVLLPEAKDSWPRTVMMVTAQTTVVDEEAPAEESEQEPGEESSEEPAEDATEAPAEGEEGEEPAEPQPQEATSLMIFTMVQESPWEPYKISYIGDVQPTVTVPNLAPAWLGAQLIPPASPFLSIAPEELPAIYVDVLDKGDESEYIGLFDEHALSVATKIRAQRQTVVERLAETGSEETTEVEFSAQTTSHAPISLGTLDSGAIVAIDLLETEKITPSKDDVVVKWPDNEIAKALTGAAESAKGVEGRYSVQLFFSVPSQGSTEPITLLAVQQSILSYEVIQ